MTGGSLVGLILLSMAWLFFAGGAVTNFSVLRIALRAKEAERVPSGIPFIPGVVGSLAAFFTIPALAPYGVAVPWPWLWILLPLFLDVYCLGWILLLGRNKTEGNKK
jgi:MFS-type transporter involved in bile tolerance (Atg22 family)